MQFDLVITNPPYQDSSHGEKKNTLWRKFLDLGVERLAGPNGYVSLVIPSSWMGSKRLLKKYFIPNDLIYINKDECRRHFTVGSTFSYFIMRKGEYKGSTTIVNKQIDKTISRGAYDIRDLIFEAFPRNISHINTGIVKKVLGDSRPLLGVLNDTSHHCVHKDRWRLQPDKKFAHPIHNTPSKLYWYTTPHQYQGHTKIIIPTTTYFRRMMITDHGTTQSFCYYLVPLGVDPEIALHNINNIVFDYINECFRYANWNNVQILKRLPQIPMDHHLTDEEVFEHFDLNGAEQAEIVAAVHWRKNGD